MKMRFNTENLTNIHDYHNRLAREIDDALWIGEEETAEALELEYKHVTDLRDAGEIYYPKF